MKLDIGGILVSGWSVDSRTLEPGDLYFALRGPSHDGHNFVEQALRKGASGVVVDHPSPGVEKALIVEDTLAALQSMAQKARACWDGQVVAGTGSADKTTTKGAIAHLLSPELKGRKPMRNLK